MDRGIPRDGYTVTDLDGKQIGAVTSGSPAPFLKKNIALAYVPLQFSAAGSEVAVEVRGRTVKCKVVPHAVLQAPQEDLA